MIIIGNEYIPYHNFEVIHHIDDIKTTSSNSIVVFSFDLEIMQYCFRNNIPYAIYTNSIKEVIFGNNLGARYIIIEEAYCIEIQKIAENYMFDSKILVAIEDDSIIEIMAKNGIDGVIYNKLLEGLQR